MFTDDMDEDEREAVEEEAHLGMTSEGEDWGSDYYVEEYDPKKHDGYLK